VRLLNMDGGVEQQLNVVPAQFIATATATPTLGIERAYSHLDYEIQHAPFTDTDFIPPSVRVVAAIGAPGQITFSVEADDVRSADPLAAGEVRRVVALYRGLNQAAWTRAELVYNPGQDRWSRNISASGAIEYFVQAVDASGNVATALDYGNPFRVSGPRLTYLPALNETN
jgi:hypothetical protein